MKHVHFFYPLVSVHVIWVEILNVNDFVLEMINYSVHNQRVFPIFNSQSRKYDNYFVWLVSVEGG